MPAPTACCIGNFDGVHLGHRALLDRARAGVGPEGRVVAVTFDPHPLAVLRPGDAPPRLVSLKERTELLHRAGADEVVVLNSTDSFLATDAVDFIRDLQQRLHFTLVVEGPGFRFGRGRTGTLELLKKLGVDMGFAVATVDRVQVTLRDCSKVTASSSLARWLLALGRVEDVARILGRPFELAGRVVRADQRGRTIGYPTANIDHGDLMLPADGIYAARAELPDGSTRAAAVSVGTKPTFGRSERTCESFLLDFNGWTEAYGWPLRLSFAAWIREQYRFDSVEALIAQMGRDVERVRRVMEEAGEPQGATA
ncbi:MAG: riboflavin biosynthesis protein RibF [Phycisphaeraceae bacterium]|nr:riboflavin biosynthesis protein RibF [Phycisphaeraceae bacterium]